MNKFKWTPFREIIAFESSDFFELMKNQSMQTMMCEKIDSGDVVIVRGVVSNLEIDEIISKVINYEFISFGNPKITEGVSNLKYQSIKATEYNSTDGEYAAVDNSYYFFPWNPDELGIFERFQDIYDVVIRINGYEPEVIKANTPINRVVQRFHLIHYPLNSGEITLHTDPKNIIKVNSGIYFSEYGLDYKDGGFYAIDASMNKINLDQKVKKGDLILFSPNLAHGVQSISMGQHEDSASSGRFFFHMSLVESHEFSDRQKSVGLKMEAS